MDAERAEAVTREVCINLNQALDKLAAEGQPINPIVVIFPGNVGDDQALAEAYARLSGQAIEANPYKQAHAK